jgi:toxin-antitoxin system PIN domain toxin
MTWLLDGNVLVALSLPNPIHHERVHRWLAATRPGPYAICPVGEGALLRLHMIHGADKSARAAWETLRRLRAHSDVEAWPENFSYSEVPCELLTGYGQVTDAWLAELARRKGGRVATLDEAFLILHADTTTLLPV